MKVAKHIVEARREKLSRLLEQHRYLSVPELCAQLGISEATARRDLTALSLAERITRTHGGALPELEHTFTPLQQRSRVARAAKARIAASAYAYLQEGMVCYLDGGTTMLALAQHLRKNPLSGLTVLTNNLAAAELLAKVDELDVRLLGGRWLKRQSLLIGPEALHAIAAWKIDTAFFSAQGMDASGLWNTQQDIITHQHAVMAKSTRSMFCIDAAKLNQHPGLLLDNWANVPLIITDATRAQLTNALVPFSRTRFLLV